MIQSILCGDTEALYRRTRVARFANVEAVARRKLEQLASANALRDLASLPGISADTALRLARFFNTSHQFWMNLQANYDAQVAEDAAGRVIAKIKPCEGVAMLGARG